MAGGSDEVQGEARSVRGILSTHKKPRSAARVRMKSDTREPAGSMLAPQRISHVFRDELHRPDYDPLPTPMFTGLLCGRCR